jgi:hypothetical protein
MVAGFLWQTGKYQQLFLEEKKNETEINSFIGNGHTGRFGAERVDTGGRGT